MIGDFAHLARIRNEEELFLLMKKCHADGHGLFLPTHVIRKAGEDVGYFSIGAVGVKLVVPWIKTELPARETFNVINSMEAASFIPGPNATNILVPVPSTSPMFPLMERMGYKDTGAYHLFHKEL